MPLRRPLHRSERTYPEAPPGTFPDPSTKCPQHHCDVSGGALLRKTKHSQQTLRFLAVSPARTSGGYRTSGSRPVHCAHGARRRGRRRGRPGRPTGGRCCAPSSPRIPVGSACREPDPVPLRAARVRLVPLGPPSYRAPQYDQPVWSGTQWSQPQWPQRWGFEEVPRPKIAKHPPRTLPGWLAVALVSALVGALAGGGLVSVFASRSPQTIVREYFPSTPVNVRTGDIQAILASVLPAVVSIDTSSFRGAGGVAGFVQGAGRA